MISDSPYQLTGLILTPKRGMITGLLSALLILGLFTLLEMTAGFLYLGLLTAAVKDSLVIYFSAGIVFGLLYALCQQSIPVRGLIGVGIFYGFIIWLITGLVLGAFLNASLAKVKKQIDYSEYGGAVLLGVNGVVIIGHGRSSATAVKNAILRAKEEVERGINDRIIEAVSKAGVSG